MSLFLKPDFLENLKESQLAFLQSLVEIRNPILDQFFIFLNFFDTIYFYLLFIPIVWVFYSRKWGIALLFLVILSGTVNALLKNYFSIPRPFHSDALINLIHVGGYSFPSGAAQSALLLSGLLILEFRKNIWAWIVGINYFLWISFSRLYLGVHYPIDILGGWIVGAILLVLFCYFFPRLKPFFERHKTYCLVGLLLALALITDFYPKKVLFQTVSVALGVCVGSYFTVDSSILQKNLYEKFCKILICFLGVFAGYFLLSRPFFGVFAFVLPFFFITLWMMILMDLTCKIFRKRENPK